ncbi:MAG: hypothetical protein HC794_09800 [Nitrospiraceae bacterium]|nr:hypothetical protein [Nitrospiraceae bacterium]
MTDLNEEFCSAVREALWDDLLKREREDLPLLAHYTSMANAENILSSGQLWFSNPRNMNDWDELRLGIELLRLMARSQFDRHLGTGTNTVTDVLASLLHAIEQCIEDFETHELRIHTCSASPSMNRRITTEFCRCGEATGMAEAESPSFLTALRSR